RCPAVQPVARDQLKLDVEVAPVGRETGGGLVPGRPERRALDLLCRLGLVDPDELELAADPFSIDAREEIANHLRRRSRPAARLEPNQAPTPPRVRGPEERRGPRGGPLVRNCQAQPSNAPALGKALLKRIPVGGETHPPERTLQTRGEGREEARRLA